MINFVSSSSICFGKNISIILISFSSFSIRSFRFAFSKASIVSSTDTVAPALNPNKALTPLSLNMSADAIPPANDLCICSAVCLKSKPVTAATLPVIFNIL